MTAPQDPPMQPKSLLLRVYSVRRTSEKQEPACPTPQTWEVRAESEMGQGLCQGSLFYTEVSPRQLPPIDSLIHVTIDGELTTINSAPDDPPPPNKIRFVTPPGAKIVQE